MLGAGADGDQARGYPHHPLRRTRRQAQQAPGRAHPDSARHQRADAEMHRSLHRLQDHSRSLPALLHAGQVGGGQPVFAQRRREQPRGGDSVLDGEVDPDPADRGHGVGGVAEAQQPVGVPAPQPVQPDVEDEHIVHGSDR